ncbi:MAG: hypothetical protein KDC92_10140 [Bacteroidetes bacterium]|nr:hypothetical protein [Bacteroidota bacterium]
MKLLLKILKILLLIIICLGAIFFITKLVVDEKLPEGKEGLKAELIAMKMLKAINHKAWKKTESVRWNFADRHQLLWDKKRNLAKVEWGGNTVFVNLSTQKGYALVEGKEVEDQKLVDKAYAWWANDSYWLNPISKIYDAGVTRKLVESEDGKKSLLVTYSSGGVTPGDSYLWHLGDDGLPTEWQMWVKIIPFKGMPATWENWKESETGVKYASKHKLGPLTTEITDVEMTFDLMEWFDADPFGNLMKE